MVTLKNKLGLFVVFLGLVTLVSCSKHNENLTTEFNSRKAESETLISQINESMARMKPAYDAWRADLETAWNKTDADTAKINNLKGRIAAHEANGATVMAFVDSVKMYMNAPTDNDDAMQATLSGLNSNFDQLSNTWKDFQDTHNNLQQEVQDLTVTTAGNAIDSANGTSLVDKATQTMKDAGNAVKTATKKVTGTNNTSTDHHHNVKETEGGVKKNSNNGNDNSSTTNDGTEHHNVRNTTGGIKKNSSN